MCTGFASANCKQRNRVILAPFIALIAIVSDIVELVSVQSAYYKYLSTKTDLVKIHNILVININLSISE